MQRNQGWITALWLGASKEPFDAVRSLIALMSMICVMICMRDLCKTFPWSLGHLLTARRLDSLDPKPSICDINEINIRGPSNMVLIGPLIFKPIGTTACWPWSRPGMAALLASLAPCTTCLGATPNGSQNVTGCQLEAHRIITNFLFYCPCKEPVSC